MLAETGRDLVHRALAPLAARLPHVNPNSITLLGLGVSLLAGCAFALTDRSPAWFLVAAALGVVFGLLDALDGVIARTHNKATPWGDFLDHACDRLSGLLALGGLAVAGHTNDVLLLLLMLGTLWHGFLGTQLEASFGARCYRGVGIAESILFAIVYSITAFAIHAAELPFHFHDPIFGARLSVTDGFAVLALPLVVIGTVQRFWLARTLWLSGAAGSERSPAAYSGAAEVSR